MCEVIRILVNLLILTILAPIDEAGFDVLVGTEESRVPSLHYTERAYVMSKGFIIHALQHPVGGLEGVTAWLYLSPDGPQLLRQVITESEAVDHGGEVTEARGPGGGPASVVLEPSLHMMPLTSGALKMLRKHVLVLKDILYNKLGHSAG